jgi:hypothetical protein
MGKKNSKKHRDRAPITDLEQVVGPEALLVALTEAKRTVEGAQKTIESLVRDARASGITWPQVGRALGVTTQAAQQRYGRTLSLERTSVS